MVALALFVVLVLALWLLVGEPGSRVRRILRDGGGARGVSGVIGARGARGVSGARGEVDPERRMQASSRLRMSRKTAGSERTVSGRKRTVLDADSVPLVVHELATLLEAGRSPQQLWSDAAMVCRSRSREDDGKLWHEFAEIFEACARFAMLGYSASLALFRESKRETLPVVARQGLEKLAICVAVSEESGAPLSCILRRFAEQSEDEIDANHGREAVLAGPRATAKLLAWLPVCGLLLGAVAGADVASIFLGSPWGLALLVAGAVLMICGKVWSARLVRQAEVPPL